MSTALDQPLPAEGAAPGAAVENLFAAAVRRAGAALPLMSGERAPILFGRGIPDQRRYPVGELERLLAEVLDEEDRGALTYETRPCYPALARALVARHRERDGVALDASQIMATNGVAGAIALVASALIEPGDVVIVEELSYWGALRTFRLAGADLVTVPLDAQGMRVDELQTVLGRLRAEGRRAKFIYTIVNNHSPTAAVLPQERRVELARLARNADVAIVQDDTYGDIRFADYPQPLLALAPERTLHLGSFSKTMAPGLRLGWIAAPAGVITLLGRTRNDLGSSAIIQRAVARYMEGGHYARQLAGAGPFYREKRDLMLAALSRYCADHCSWSVPSGGFFLWIAMHRGESERLRALAEEEGVQFMEGNDFSANRNWPAHIRLSYSDPTPDEIDEGVKRLGRAFERLAKQT